MKKTAILHSFHHFFNKDNYNELEQELINILESKNIKYYNSVNYIDINNIRLYFLNNELYDNENDNSNIIYFSYYNYNNLFLYYY